MVYGKWRSGGRKINKQLDFEIIEEWLETFDEYEEEEEILSEVQPYRKRSENVKISDQNN